MNWQYNVAAATVLAASLAAGCAANAPTEARQALPATESTAQASTNPVAKPAPVAISDQAAKSSEPEDGLIEALPAAQPAPTQAAANTTPPVMPMVCQMERKTGTNRKVKVCRRPQSALEEADTRRTFDSLRRTQIGEHR